MGYMESMHATIHGVSKGFRSSKPREYGEVAVVKDGYGFIKCCDRDARMFFHFSSLLDPKVELRFAVFVRLGASRLNSSRVGDEVEFAVETVEDDKLNALDVLVVPVWAELIYLYFPDLHGLQTGTAKFEEVSEQPLVGTIKAEAVDTKTRYTW